MTRSATPAAFTRTGVILYVEDYPACRDFYRDIVGLPVLFDTPELTCFAFGDAYLMVERDDADAEPAAREHHATCLRLNVPDVRAHADRLAALGVAVEVQEHAWGTVARFTDPAGNLCAFKDDARFEQQIRDHRTAT